MVPAAPQGAVTTVPGQELPTMSVNDMAQAEGFDGLDFDSFGTFPVIALKRGSYKTSNGEDLGQSFNCYITSSRPKYLYKTKVPDNDPRSDVCYSYDQQTSNGKELHDIFADWASKGCQYEMKKYLELTVTMEDGRLMYLSVPPTSISRFSAFTAERLMKRLKAATTLVRVGIGPEVTKTVFPFNPLSFEIVG
jgi:hypothetical protein